MPEEMNVPDGDAAAQVADFDAELAETDGLPGDGEGATATGHDDSASDEARASSDDGGSDDSPAATAQTTDEGGQAEDGGAAAAGGEAEDVASAPETVDRSRASKERPYKWLDNNYYSWAELEELGLAQDVMTNAHQGPFFQRKYQDLLKGGEAKPEGEAPEQPKQATIEERQAASEQRVRAYEPMLQEAVAAGELDEELLEFAPKFASSYAADRAALSNLLYQVPLQVGNTEVRGVLGLVGALGKDYGERYKAATTETEIDQASNRIASEINNLAGAGYEGLKDEDHQVEFFQWLVDEQGGGLSAEEATRLSERMLEASYLSFLKHGKPSKSPERTKPRAETYSRGSGSRTSQGAPQSGPFEADAIADLAADLEAADLL